MASGLFGLGTGTPSRFPYPDRPQSGPGLGAGQGQVTRARLVIVVGPAGTVAGVFVYRTGTIPAPGNPPIGWVTDSPTDPFGNVLPVTGIGEQDAAGYAVIHGSQAIFAVTGQSSSLAGDVQASGPGELDVISPIYTGADVSAFFSLRSKTSNFGFGPVANFLQGTAINCVGGTPANPTQIVTDGWNTLAPINGWANVTTLKYSLLTNRMVMVAGVITSAGAAGNPIFANLPAGYRPATQQETAAGLHGAPPAGGAFMRVAVNGDLSIPGSTVGTGPWSVSWTFSLDYA
jgi:hypothetical protein